jgi:integrase
MGMALTQVEIEKAQAKDTPYRLTDGQGLFLLVQPSGSKLWRWNYRFAGKQQTMAYGVYPEVTLKEARVEHGKARALLHEGMNPSEEKSKEKLKDRAGVSIEQAEELLDKTTAPAKGSFAWVQERWFEQWREGKNERHVQQVKDRIATDITPKLGRRPITEIEAPEIVAVALAIEVRGAGDVARRSLNTMSQIFRFGIAHGYCRRNPAADIKAADFLKGVDPRNFARVAVHELPALLFAIEHYNGLPVTKIALQLMVRTFLRTSELILAPWSEFQFEGKRLTNLRWEIPGTRMKKIQGMQVPHYVPLSRQVIGLLEELHGYTGETKWLFPGQKDLTKCMSKNTILAALDTMGYKGKMTGHGFRGLASTILHEQGYPDDHIEIQLAHQERNSVKAAYNFAKYLEPRAQMMQDWSDYLDKLLAQRP